MLALLSASSSRPTSVVDRPCRLRNTLLRLRCSHFIEFRDFSPKLRTEMLRIVAGRVSAAVRGAVVPRTLAVGAQNARAAHDGPQETDQEFDARYEKFFNRTDIDHWEIRKAMNDLAGMDLVPEPKIVCAALRACRRLNDIALAIRFLESVKEKGGDHAKVIYPYVIQEIRPTLDELGISTPEELGYDKPELALVNVDDIH